MRSQPCAHGIQIPGVDRATRIVHAVAVLIKHPNRIRSYCHEEPDHP